MQTPALRPDAPSLRTAESLLKKNEQIADAIERNAITAKQAEQLNQCIKTPIRIASMEMQYWSMVEKLSRAGRRDVPVPRSPMLRSVVGLGEVLSPSDGPFVRGELPEK